jgi:hypothetical protein
MKPSLPLRLHLATWAVAIIIAIIPLFSGKPSEQFAANIIAVLFWMAVYYLFFLYIFPKFFYKGKLTTYFALSFMVLALLPFMGYTLLFLSRALFNGSFDNFYDGYSFAMHFSGFKAMLVAGLFGSFFRLISDYQKQ